MAQLQSATIKPRKQQLQIGTRFRWHEKDCVVLDFILMHLGDRLSPNDRLGQHWTTTYIEPRDTIVIYESEGKTYAASLDRLC